MTTKESRLVAHLLELAHERGYDVSTMLPYVNSKTVTHVFILALDQEQKCLIGIYDVAADKYLVSGCGIKFTPAEWQASYTQE